MLWAQYALMFALFAPLLATAEWANPECERREPPPPWWRRGTDWAFAALQLALVPALAVGVNRWAPALVAHGPLHGVAASLPGTATAAGAFLVADFTAYWAHRGEHHFRAAWRWHSVHHSSVRLDWLAGRRFHPLDVVVQQVLPVGVVVALGVPLVALVPYFLVAGLVTLLAHCNVAVPGGWLARVVVTPGYHRSHHERGRAGSNFALVLPLSDILFGTASFERGPRRFGTAGPVPETGFVALLHWGFGGRPRAAQRASTSTPAQKDTALAT